MVEVSCINSRYEHKREAEMYEVIQFRVHLLIVISLVLVVLLVNHGSISGYRLS
jgi:hypothetical protein